MTIIDDPPSGWGAKPQDLEDEDDWEAEDSMGQCLCAELKLGRGRPIMFNCTGLAYMFEAGGKFYFWYCIDLAVSEITSPTKLDEIIKVMKEKGEDALKLKKKFLDK
ncbi:hypothetical protein DTO166G4_1379 [Paecilomyces variotii]|nr:hypothetical protein DTO166G4_1379 [Paecilomyces variotii]KAJ9242741.1 hypothetical protein DTO166G5_496 [Paecilomyces variotii]KAJ9266460.1 hypothetical protein DTO195F2_983 [Paecilomyces variotii]KAJ9368636.1 hypothetical protein DTO282E5_6644 [Paecilomyces variotii]